MTTGINFPNFQQVSWELVSPELEPNLIRSDHEVSPDIEGKTEVRLNPVLLRLFFYLLYKKGVVKETREFTLSPPDDSIT